MRWLFNICILVGLCYLIYTKLYQPGEKQEQFEHYIYNTIAEDKTFKGLTPGFELEAKKKVMDQLRNRGVLKFNKEHLQQYIRMVELFSQETSTIQCAKLLHMTINQEELNDIMRRFQDEQIKLWYDLQQLAIQNGLTVSAAETIQTNEFHLSFQHLIKKLDNLNAIDAKEIYDRLRNKETIADLDACKLTRIVYKTLPKLDYADQRKLVIGLHQNMP